MAVRRHQVESTARASIAAVLNMTGETHTDIGAVVGLSVTIVGRRQRGTTPWTIAELGLLADHWGIRPHLILAGPSETLAALPVERIAKLRTAKGLPSAA